MRIGGKVEVGGKHMRSAISEFTRPHLRPSFLLLGAFLAVAPISIYGSSQSENNYIRSEFASEKAKPSPLPQHTSHARSRCQGSFLLIFRGWRAQVISDAIRNLGIEVTRLSFFSMSPYAFNTAAIACSPMFASFSRKGGYTLAVSVWLMSDHEKSESFQ